MSAPGQCDLHAVSPPVPPAVRRSAELIHVRPPQIAGTSPCYPLFSMYLLLTAGCVGSIDQRAIAMGFGPVMSAVWLVDRTNTQGLWVTNVTSACSKWEAAYAAKAAFDAAMAAADPEDFCADMMEPSRDYTSAMNALEHAGANVLYISGGEPFVASTETLGVEVVGVMREYTDSSWASAMDGWDVTATADEGCGATLMSGAGATPWMIATGALRLTSVVQGDSLEATIDGELASDGGPIAADFTAEWCEMATVWDPE